MKTCLPGTLLACCSLSGAADAHIQVMQTIPGVQDGPAVIRNSVPRPTNEERAPLPDDAWLNEASGPAQAGQSVILEKIDLIGVTVFSEDEMDRLWESDLGAETSVTRLHRIAEEIELFYHDRGYVFARARLLRDGYPGGVVTIRVSEGGLGATGFDPFPVYLTGSST